MAIKKKSDQIEREVSQMKKVFGKTLLLYVSLVVVVVASGCTNWKKKYQGLEVEYRNLQGRYDNCVASLDSSALEKNQLGAELARSQKTINELQREIEDRNVSPGQASGFGDDYDVAFDPAAGTITVTLPNALLFSVGQASLKKSTLAELDHVQSVLNDRYRGRVIDVVGHTDSDPVKKTKKFWKDNWELSAERSLSVLRYLVDRGVAKDKVRAVACGASKPIASNSTSSGKARNRRVEIVVHMR